MQKAVQCELLFFSCTRPPTQPLTCNYTPTPPARTLIPRTTPTPAVHPPPHLRWMNQYCGADFMGGDDRENDEEEGDEDDEADAGEDDDDAPADDAE